MENVDAAFVYVLADGKDFSFPKELPAERKYRKQLQKLGCEEVYFFRGARGGRYKYFAIDILKMLKTWLSLKEEGKFNRATFYFDGLDYFMDQEKKLDVAYQVLELEGRCKDVQDIASEIALNERENLWRGYEPDKE